MQIFVQAPYISILNLFGLKGIVEINPVSNLLLSCMRRGLQGSTLLEDVMR